MIKKYKNQLEFLIKSLNLKKIKKVMIIGNYGCGNVGDEAMLQMIIKDLHKIKIKEIVVPSRNPKMLGKLHPKIIKPLSLKSTIKEFFSTDLIILGSGTLFSKNSSFFAYFISLLPIIGKIFKKKSVFYSIGFSSTTSHFIKLAIKISMNFADKISVRDLSSLRNLKKIGLKKEIFLFEDPTINLKLITKNVAPILQKEKIHKNKFLIGMSLNYVVNQKINEKIENEFPKIIDWLAKQFNSEIIFFTFDPAFTHPRPDYKLAMKIKSQLKHPKNFKILDYYPSPNLVLNLMKKMDFFIAMRYHSILFAHKINIPFMGIIYEEKNKAFLKSIGKKGIPLFKLNFKNVAKEISKTLKNKKVFKKIRN